VPSRVISVPALTCAGADVDRLERAREAREAHAIEVAEVRDETEESFEGVVIVGHSARRLAR
jgi:hypothetical protein